MTSEEGQRPQLSIYERGMASSNALAATIKELEYGSSRSQFEVVGSLMFYLREDTIHQLSHQQELVALSNLSVTERDRERAQKLRDEIQSFTQMLEQAKIGNYTLIGQDFARRGSLLSESSGGQNQRLGKGLTAISEQIIKANGVGDPFKEPRPAWQDPQFKPQPRS